MPHDLVPVAAPPSSDLDLRLHQQDLAGRFGLFALGRDELQPVLDEACRVAAEGLGLRHAKLLRFDPGRGDFLTVAGVGWRPGVVGVCRLGPGRDSPAGYARDTGESVVSNRLEEERRFAVPPVLAEHGIHSAIGLPPGRWTPMALSREVLPYAQDPSPLFARVPASDGRFGPRRA